MASQKKDGPAALAEKLVQTLREQKHRTEVAYPLTLRRLADLADPTAAPKTLLSAVSPQRKAFSQHALVARKDLHAPVALLEDLPQLAASPLLLEYLLRTARTAANHAASAAELKRKVTSKLQKPFQEALHRQLQDDLLPPPAGWILIKNTRKLFLVQDLHLGRPAAAPAAPAPATAAPVVEPPPPAAAPAATFAPAFDAAFEQLDRQAGAHNFVSLVRLRQALPVGRQTFDAGLRQLRLTGRYTLSAAEGRHGLSPEEQEAGIMEDGALLLYVSRKAP
jgi:hypothetical protein